MTSMKAYIFWQPTCMLDAGQYSKYNKPKTLEDCRSFKDAEILLYLTYNKNNNY